MFFLITGGSASGKSAYAEDKVLSLCGGQRVYLATMDAGDEESQRRIAKHRAQRAGKGFETVECPTHMEEVMIPENSIVLLECLSNLAANEMFGKGGRGKDSQKVILEGIRHIRKRAAHLVVVTNNIFDDSEFYDDMTESYRELLGSLNCRLSAMADQVTEVTLGIPVCVKNKEGRS